MSESLQEPLVKVLKSREAGDGAAIARRLSTFAGAFDVHEARSAGGWDQEIRTILEQLLPLCANGSIDAQSVDGLRHTITTARMALMMGDDSQKRSAVPLFETKVRSLKLSPESADLLRKFLLIISAATSVEVKKEVVTRIMKEIQLAAQTALTPPAPSSKAPAPGLTSLKSAPRLFTNSQVEGFISRNMQTRQVSDKELVRLLEVRPTERYIQTGDSSYQQLLLVQPDQQILLRSPNGAVVIRITKSERGRASFASQLPGVSTPDTWGVDPNAPSTATGTPAASSMDAPSFIGTRYHYVADKIIQRPLALY